MLYVNPMWREHFTHDKLLHSKQKYLKQTYNYNRHNTNPLIDTSIESCQHYPYEFNPCTLSAWCNTVCFTLVNSHFNLSLLPSPYYFMYHQ